MSKRDRGASLQTYLDEGYAPEAVVNYLCLLGWSPKENREKMPLAEIIQLFDLPQILRHNARFDIGKLDWLGRRILARDERRPLPRTGNRGVPPRRVSILNKYPAAYVTAAIATCKGKVKRFGELAAYAGFYFTDDVKIDPAAGVRDRESAGVPKAARRARPSGTIQRSGN